MNVFTKCHGNPSSSFWHILVWTKVDRLTDRQLTSPSLKQQHNNKNRFQDISGSVVYSYSTWNYMIYIMILYMIILYICIWNTPSWCKRGQLAALPFISVCGTLLMSAIIQSLGQHHSSVNKLQYFLYKNLNTHTVLKKNTDHSRVSRITDYRDTKKNRKSWASEA